MEKLQTRREFLRSTGKVLAGVALVSTVNPVLSAVAGDAAAGAAVHPFPYVKLDPETTQKRGYDSFYSKGGCGVGAADAIIGQLAEVVGYPFNQVPVELYANAAGGYGMGSLCGALGGALGAVALVCAPADAKKISGELLGWYRTNPFPSYQPVLASVTSVADSVNCIDSCGKYMAATGVEMGSDARKARCAGLVADVVKKTVELLNAHFGV